ncbi:SDR family NAD(P)-dependent oxidoreductase [Pseudomonas sp. A-B-19]|uniref:SDR family NAD(P)-dependent oxidoreductase n=1 Tax=Pseudomonas sp. A-B-19 TaxID=2832405 RepID=UPI001CC15C35|nr:glucose 1-dehydrogenase [Pseudomonas sp. A-B-19]
MGKLHDKVAVITGGGSGIGLAIARRFVEEGAQVVITGRRQEALDEALTTLGSRVTAFQGDVSRRDDVERLYKQVGQSYGRIDVLVANAGVIHPAPLEFVTDEQYESQFDTNVRGVFQITQKALPLLNDGASIVLVSSIAHFKALEGHCVYAATKAAVRSFARSWAYDLKHRGIRVNCLSPGPVKTPIIGKMGVPDESLEAFERTLGEMIPLGRLGRPEELAAAALFLASAESSFITGVDLCADGGLGQI